MRIKKYKIKASYYFSRLLKTKIFCFVIKLVKVFFHLVRSLNTYFKLDYCSS